MQSPLQPVYYRFKEMSSGFERVVYTHTKRNSLSFCFSFFQLKLLGRRFFLFWHQHSTWVYTVENHSISRKDTTYRAYYNKEKIHQYGLSQKLRRKPVVLLGMMNKDTKKPTEKVLLCRKPATPTVVVFAGMKVNEIENNGDVENSEDRKANREGVDWCGDGGFKGNHTICQ